MPTIIKSFASSFLNYISFISFSYHWVRNAMARETSLMVNRSGETGHPYFVPEIMEKVVKVTSLSRVFTIGFP